MRKEANGGVSDDEAELEVDEDDEAGWDNWEVESADSSDSGGWKNVSSDGDDLVISDSDDEAGPKVTKRKLQVLDEENDAESDDTKSVVSAAITEISQTTKKLSLLAQQKVYHPITLPA